MTTIKRIKTFTAAVLAGVCLMGCGFEDADDSAANAAESGETAGETADSEAAQAEQEEIVKQESFLWLAYWSHEGYEEEVAALGEMNEAVSAFGVLFTVDGDKLIMPEETEELLIQLAENDMGQKIYLTYINDLQLSDGSYNNKDWNLLERILKDDARRAAHIEEILEIAERYPLYGIEIDYENMRKNEKVYPYFVKFVEELRVKCEEKGLALRVLLETSDVTKAEYPAGVEYSIMCYNLYGNHSGPGPKADFDFLEEIFEDAKTLSGKVNAAFSTGGFVWEGDECVRSLTEEEAVELYQSLGSEASELVRDKKSGGVHFTYKEDGKKYTVWYADGETLALWKETALSYGISSFSIWRADGNVKESLKRFAE